MTVFVAEVYSSSYEPTYVIGVYSDLDSAMGACEVSYHDDYNRRLEWLDAGDGFIYSSRHEFRISEWELDQ